MDNGLYTWARLLYLIHKQSLCFPAKDKNTLHIFEMLRLQKSVEMQQRCSIYIPLHHPLELSQYCTDEVKMNVSKICIQQ
jgi:hypothetical protein